MQAPDEQSSESAIRPPPPPPSAPGAPPPPPAAAAAAASAKDKDGAKKLKLKATDQVPFESLRSFQAGEVLYGKGKAWQGPVSWHKHQWRHYTPRSASPSATSSPLDALKVVTYNVLFASECMGDRRTAALLSILHATDADIICLAEGMLAPRGRASNRSSYAAVSSGTTQVCVGAATLSCCRWRRGLEPYSLRMSNSIEVSL